MRETPHLATLLHLSLMEDTQKVHSSIIPAQNGRAAYPKSASEWECHRETISRLYVDENRSLKEVQRLMEDVYRFKAT
jgi:Clr5 domain